MDIVFNKNWFEKYQSRLLWLLNNSLTKRWFRWCLRIRRYDLDIKASIVKIAPNYFTIDAGMRFFNTSDLLKTNFENPDLPRSERRKAKHYWKKIKMGKMEDKQHLLPALTTAFRTHDKYAKRLYYAFKPFWYLLHFMDWAMLDRVEAVTHLSFGFTTLTQYPGSTGANNPVDGFVSEGGDNSTLATLRAAAGNNADTTSTEIQTRLVCSATTNQFSGLDRGLEFYDTSAIGSGSTISAAVNSLYGSTNFNGGGTLPDIHVASGNAASTTTLATSDYAQANFGSTSYGSVVGASFSTSAYNDITFGAPGIANISKTGISKFSTQLSWDINNSFTGTWSNGRQWQLYPFGSDQSGTANDPKLVVTYAAGAAAGTNFLAMF